IAAKGAEIRERFPRIGWRELREILNDRSLVRYPCEIVFEASLLLEGEFAHALPNSENPADGFRLVVHPLYSLQLDRVPLMALYQLVRVNYGEFASPDDAETFGASALGMTKDEYYHLLCGIADEVGGIE